MNYVFVLWAELTEAPEYKPYVIFSEAPDIDNIRDAVEAICSNLMSADDAKDCAMHMSFDGFPVIPELTSWEDGHAIRMSSEEAMISLCFGKFNKDNLSDEIKANM